MNSTQRVTRTLLFDFAKEALEDVLQDIDAGRLRLPYYHRDWCWPSDQILNLIESIGQGDPIGSLTFVGATPLCHRAFSGVNRPILDGSPVYLVLDGQQRMTAAYQACYTAAPVNIMAGTRSEHRLYFFDMERAISSQARMKDAILSIVTDTDGRPLRSGGVDYTDPRIQFKRGIFPTNLVFNYETYNRHYKRFWDSTNNATRRSQALQTLQDFCMTVLSSFHSYKIPVQKLNRPMDDDTLRRIYVKLNLPTWKKKSAPHRAAVFR